MHVFFAFPGATLAKSVLRWKKKRKEEESLSFTAERPHSWVNYSGGHCGLRPPWRERARTSSRSLIPDHQSTVTSRDNGATTPHSRRVNSTNFLCFSPFGSFLRSNDVNLKSSLNFSNMSHRHRYLMPPLTRWSCWWINFQCDKDCFLVNGPKMALTTLRPKGIDLVSIYLKWRPSIHIWTSILGTGAQEGLEKL